MPGTIRPNDPDACGDSDMDTCDDCTAGSFDPGNDGPTQTPTASVTPAKGRGQRRRSGGLRLSVQLSQGHVAVADSRILAGLARASDGASYCLNSWQPVSLAKGDIQVTLEFGAKNERSQGNILAISTVSVRRSRAVTVKIS